MLDKIFASKTRIMFAILPFEDTAFYLLEYLYDRGFRRGDFTFIITISGIERIAYFKENQPDRYKKIDEFVYNSWGVFQPIFVDEIGAAFIGKSFGVFDAIPSPYS